MRKLDGFHKGTEDKPARAIPQPPSRQPDRPARPPVDRDRCPVGWDEDIWHLALVFDQRARADGIELRTGRPIVYAEIAGLVASWHLREKSFTQVSTGCDRRLLADDDARKCWYHTEDAGDRAVTWVEVVEIIMAEFWSCIQDEHALDWFRQKFAEYGRAAVTHWRSLDMINAISARPKPQRAVMRRRKPDATMQAGSKEGE